MTKNEGFIEQFNVEIISGWVRLNHSEKDYVYVSFNEEESRKYRVDSVSRNDLTESDRMFTIPFPENFVNGNSVSVTIDDADGNPLSNSPRIVITSQNEIDKVLKGKSNWLFLTNDSNSSLDYITGSMVLDSQIINVWYDVLCRRSQFSHSIGCRYLSIIVPEKESIYDEYLPDQYSVSDKRPLIELLNKCSDESTLNLCNEFSECSTDEFLYYKGDTHWNYYGAYLAYSLLMKNLEMESSIVPFDYYLKKKIYLTGDLITKIVGTNLELADHIYDFSPTEKVLFKNTESTTGRREEFYNSQAFVNKRIMLWHTSSIDWMKPFLLKTFSNICFIWEKNIDWIEVCRYGPELLIFQSNERFLCSYPVDKNTDFLGNSDDK